MPTVCRFVTSFSQLLHHPSNFSLLGFSLPFPLLLLLHPDLVPLAQPTSIGVGPCPAELELVAGVLILDRLDMRLTRSVVQVRKSANPGEFKSLQASVIC